MDITTIKFGAKANKSVSSGIPSFISQEPVLMGTEGNGPQLSQTSDFGVLEQYLGYRFGEPANISRSPLFNPTVNSQIVGHDIQSNAFKALASTNTNFSAGLVGSQLQKGSQVNLISATGAQHENWGESNMAAESSSRTDTSNDMDPDNQKLPWTMNKSKSVGTGGDYTHCLFNICLSTSPTNYVGTAWIYQEKANKLIQEIISALRSCS
ncbi:hypothetical protein CASFOL_014585 [Castilleja foliolosa]|uniref:Uncharacterized protein n=1 Tax=Castilleja foliolosa TaxID=1961234 RepID=A0ABD3DN91_9LAMI